MSTDLYRPSVVNRTRASGNRILAVARHNVILRLRDPGQAITYIALPMILMVVLKPLYVRAVDGGTTQIVTGLLVMFTVFAVGIVGSSILTERQWHTWDRLRQTRLTPVEIMIGKVLPLVVLMVVQQTVLVVYGCFVIGMPAPKAWWLVAVAILVWVVTLLAIGAALATIARSVSELNMVSDVGAMVLSSMAGALVPLALLPGWVQVAAHVSPGYYALSMIGGAFRGDTEDVARSAAVLLAVAVVAGTYAVHRLARGWGRTRLL